MYTKKAAITFASALRNPDLAADYQFVELLDLAFHFHQLLLEFEVHHFELAHLLLLVLRPCLQLVLQSDTLADGKMRNSLPVLL